MALFAAIGDKFISVILRQVAHDYDLNYKELQARYCGPASFEAWGKDDVTKKARNLDVDEIDLVIQVPAPKAKEPKKKETLKEAPKKTKAAPAQMPLSKMKKADLEAELSALGLDIKGTVPILKARLKEARENPPDQETDSEEEEKPKKKKEKKKSPKKPAAEKPKKEKKKKEKTPEPEPEPEEELDEEDVCPPCVEMEISENAPLMSRLQALLGDQAEEPETDDEEEDEEDQQETPDYSQKKSEQWSEVLEEEDEE